MGRSTARAAVALSVLAAGGAAGCGGGTRQDANEPSGTYSVDVVRADFPRSQRLAKQEKLVVEVRNTDRRTIPDLAVTVDSFGFRDARQDLADQTRPVWIVDNGPTGGTTAYTNTWALGALRPGQSRRFVWRVTPVRAGSHEVHYRIAAGLDGKAKAQAAGGRAPEGTFTVRVSQEPVQARVDPKTGNVVRLSADSTQ